MSLFDFDLSSNLADRTNSAHQVEADRPYEDVDLNASDIRKLSNAQSIADFFARMHYNTDKRISKTLEDIGLTSKQLQSALEGRRIERIASQENGQFEVYLFELRSSTVSLRNELVRNFRYEHNKSSPCNYLFILTSNYRKIEFVLIERSIPTVTWQGKIYQVPSLPQMQYLSAYPHTIQVEPRKPSDSALRVLRRFVNTEIDAEMQYEKLLATYIKEEWSTEKLRLNPSYFNNRALFSDYYLLNRLPEREEWTSNDEEAAMTKGYRKIHTLYKNAYETYAEQVEDTLLSRLLEPTLKVLGFRIKPTMENSISTYSLYTMSSSMMHSTSVSGYPTSTTSIDTMFRRVSNAERTLETTMVATQSLHVAASEEKPIGYCLVYAWGRKLDSTDAQRDQLTPKDNPSAVAVALLDLNKVNWVVVTNGKQWRLYTTKAASRAINYYEIDLLDLMAMKPQQSRYGFHYFWLFFRAKAFVQRNTYPLRGNKPKEQGKVQLSTFLDEVLEEGERHARSLDDQLRKRVFEEIFPYFANGFVAHALHNQLLPANLEMLPVEESDHLLEPFFTGTLTFLYRLLFLSYAEARDLLPVRQNQQYLQQSLESMKLRVATIAGRLEKAINYRIINIYSDHETYLYDALQTLFHAIDKGNSEMNVPIYNGGLFMTEPIPNAHSSEASAESFLSTHKIPDSYLALGLELMTRTPLEASTGKRRGYDVIFIDYKDLGVRQLGSIYEGLLESKLRLTTQKAKNLRGKQEVLPLSHVYLENDHLKRRATGSYYTPDYIVKYIVEQTIGPILTKRLRWFSRHLRGMQKELEQQNALTQSGEKNPEHETYKKYQKTVDAFFDLGVLDPAMGSGHFLVEAVDFITDRILEMFEGDRWNPITYELNYTREQILLSTQKQGVIVDVAKLDDVTLLKRRILKSCIYGVDINPMASNWQR